MDTHVKHVSSYVDTHVNCLRVSYVDTHVKHVSSYVGFLTWTPMLSVFLLGHPRVLACVLACALAWTPMLSVSIAT